MLSFIRSWHDAADRLNDPREILDLDLGIGLPGLNFELKEALDSKGEILNSWIERLRPSAIQNPKSKI